MAWVVVPFPRDDPERLHVVPTYRDTASPDDLHQPSVDCPCGPRVTREFDLSGRPRQIVVHNGPN